MSESPEKDIVVVVADDAQAEETARALREGLAKTPEVLRRVVVVVDTSRISVALALSHFAMTASAMACPEPLPAFSLDKTERAARKGPFLNIQQLHQAQARNKLRPRR